MSTSIACSKLNGKSETGFAFDIAPPMATGVEYSSLRTSSEHVSAAACSAFCYDRLKDIRIIPIVMAEGKLCQVEREIGLRNIMERAHHATLEQAPKAIQIGRMDIATDIFTLGMIHRLMGEFSLQSGIPHMFIRCDEGHTFTHGLTNKITQRLTIRVLDNLADHIALSGNRANDADFPAADSSEVRPLATMAVLILAADIGLIYFDFAHELAKSAVLHRRTDAMAHIPGCAVVSAPDLAMNLQGTDTLLALRHQVNNLEPGPERIVGILEHGSRDYREAVAVPSAAIFVLTYPVKWAGFERIDFCAMAARALHAIGPALIVQVLLARFLGAESRHQSGQGHCWFHREPSLC